MNVFTVNIGECFYRILICNHVFVILWIVLSRDDVYLNNTLILDFESQIATTYIMTRFVCGADYTFIRDPFTEHIK